MILYGTYFDESAKRLYFNQVTLLNEQVSEGRRMRAENIGEKYVKESSTSQ